VFLLNGRKLDFQLAKRESSNSDGESKRSIEQRRLFIGGLNMATDDGDLFKHFSQYGKVSSAYVIRHYKTGISKRFGYVVYEDKESVKKAMYLDSESAPRTNFHEKKKQYKQQKYEQNRKYEQKYERKATSIDLSALKSREHVLDGTTISIELYKPKGRSSNFKSTQSEIKPFFENKSKYRQSTLWNDQKKNYFDQSSFIGRKIQSQQNLFSHASKKSTPLNPNGYHRTYKNFNSNHELNPHSSSSLTSPFSSFRTHMNISGEQRTTTYQE